MDQVTRRRIWILVIACAALFIAVFPAVRRAAEAKADGQLTTCWVMCRPGDYVNVRVSANRKSRQAGYLECGDSFLTDGYSRNGFIRVYSVGEGSEAWIYSGYVVTEKPKAVFENYCCVSRGRVAVRRWISGPKVANTPWIVNGSTVTVFYEADGWAVTSRGFIRSEYLEADPL